MKRLLQLIGIRKWSGEDLVSLQAEPLKTIDAFFATYGNSIFNGCEVTPAADNAYNITPGFVALQGKDQDNRDTFKVAPFPGLDNTALPVYLTLAYNVVEKEYVDGKVKPVAYDYHAAASSIRPEDGAPYLEITAAGGRRFIDAVGITQKLDKTGNGKDVTVTFAQATDRTNVQTGDKLTAILGKIARWFADLKAVAFSGKAADLTDDATHRFVTDIEKAGWGDKYTRTETDNKDAAALTAAKSYTDTLSGDVYKKTETYTKAETDNNIAGLGNAVYRKAETYTRAETDNKDTATLEAAKQYAIARIAEIIGGSPAALDTLYEIAKALNNDPNFATTIMALVNGKAPLVHTHTPEQCGAAPVNHSHAGVYQPAGNYAAADHGHTGYATTTHNHDGTYAAAAHNHNINQITGFPASMPASDVYPWAKSATKPAYNAAEVGAAPSNHNHVASQIAEETNKRFMTDAERSKLAGIETEANKYIHPLTHPASMITEQVDKRFMTDAERVKLASKYLVITNFVGNVNNITENGIHKLNQGVINTPAPEAPNGSILLHLDWDINCAYQVCWGCTYGRLYTRQKISGKWSAWRVIISELA